MIHGISLIDHCPVYWTVCTALPVQSWEHGDPLHKGSHPATGRRRSQVLDPTSAPARPRASGPGKAPQALAWPRSTAPQFLRRHACSGASRMIPHRGDPPGGLSASARHTRSYYRETGPRSSAQPGPICRLPGRKRGAPAWYPGTPLAYAAPSRARIIYRYQQAVPAPFEPLYHSSRPSVNPPFEHLP